MNNKLDNLIKELQDTKVKYSLKYIAFTLGNTKINNAEDIYYTPVRVGNDFVLAGAVVFSELEGRYILEKIDGLCDIIYIDCEKKSKSSYLKEGLFNLERLSTEIVVKSTLRYYKGNDITVESIDKLVYNILKSNNRLVGGANILIVGFGNIGFKISLKLVERGANISVLSRNINKSQKLIEAINIIKPSETISIVKAFDKENTNLISSLDIIILSHISTINEYSKIYYKTNKLCSFIDVGKGCLNKSQITNLNSRENLCYRLDVGDSIVDYLENDIKNFSKTFILPGTKIIKNKRIISRGVIGLKGDVVVNDIEKPKFIYGICNGKGGFNKSYSEEESLFIKNLIR